MSDKLQKLVHTFAALADLGQEIADTGDFHEMVRTSLHLLLGSLAIRRGAITEFDCEARVLRFIATRGLDEKEPEYVELDSQAVADLISVGLCAVKCGGDNAASRRLAERHLAVFEENRIELLLPLVVRGKLVGLILLGEKASGEPFTTEDREVLSAMGRHIGVGIQERRLLEELEHRATENRELYEGLRAIYQDTVKAFAAAIDCKDKYTQGHSERVGKYSEIIAREMGWSDDAVEGIAVAGYLHDIGKLVVERDILNAPYRIDAKQSSELNRHPSAGYEILSPIHHPYADISLMARYHHERMDGRGYPEGLSGDQIPVGARIVALADSFDAMTTDRPYKRRRSLDEVIVDFRHNSGKQFAPEVVAALCRALLKEITGETAERRIIRILGKGYFEPEHITPLLIELISELDAGMYATAAGKA
jgi:hypothetical protein